MADWPVSGDTNWNTKMKANIDIGHDADGTHKKSQMLTDMEWSTTSYAGEESITFPNGLIMKMGTITSIGGGGSQSVTFGTAFPNALTSAVASQVVSTASEPMIVTAKSITGLTLKNGTGATASNVPWIAIGY